MAITKIGTPELFDFSATNTALQLPTGTTLQRPTSPSTGEWRYNTTDKYVEYWDGVAWFKIATESASTFTAAENFNTNTYFGTGVTQEISAKFNEAANFNGSSSQIEVSATSTTPVDFSQRNYSLSLWVNTTVTANANFTMLSKYGDSDARRSFLLDIRSYGTVVRLYERGTGTSQSTSVAANINDGDWHHITVTKSSSQTIIYIDGTASVTNPNTFASNNGGVEPFRIGRDNPGSPEYFSGKIDQVRIFNTALTPEQAEDLYTDETTTTAAILDFPVGGGCVAAYQLDGNGNDVSTIYNGTTTDIGYTGLQFAPDLVWLKIRSSSDNHFLADSIRGANKLLQSNNAAQELTTTGGAIASFDTNGFTLQSTPPNYGINLASRTFVAWCWKAGGAKVTIPQGTVGNTIASEVSANVAAGFSIVKYTGNGNTSQQSYAHGLSSPPELVINKGIDALTLGTNSWVIGGTLLGNGGYMLLNRTNAKNTASSYNGNQVPNSSVVYISGTSDLVHNQNNKNFISYCFHSVPGYQKVGSYSGSGASGKIVYTTDNGLVGGTNGFEPRFVMIKRYDAGSSQNWILFDNLRVSGSNESILYPNEDFAESVYGDYIDFNSNGFTLKDGGGSRNSSPGEFIFLAIA